MTTGEIGYWLYWGLGLLFLLGCGALTWWGLFGDRSRGRRRCPNCWYDLSHSEGVVCSECGRTARSEGHLRRSRRRLLTAAAGALAASLGVAWVIEQNRHVGWMSKVPTRVLLAGLPLAGGRDSVIIEEIELRGSRRTLTPEQWDALVDRCLAGDHRAPPVSLKWQEKYGRLLDVVDGQAPPGPELRARLLELPPWISLESVRTWPPGVSPCLELSMRHWWPDGTECRLELAPPWRSSEPIVFTRSNVRSRSGCALVVPATEAAGGRVRFEAVVKRREQSPASTAGEWQTVLARPLEVPITVTSEPLERAIAADADPALQDVMREVFGLGVVKWRSGPSPLRVRFDPRPTYRDEFDGLAVGAVVEIRRDDELVRRLDLWWRAGTRGPQRSSGFRVDHENLALVSEVNEEDGRWKMTVRGEPEVALRAGSADRYWSGEFTIPLKVERRRSSAPARDWESSD